MSKHPDSKWWSSDGLIVAGKFRGGKVDGERVRLQIELGGTTWISATDIDGESGVLQPTEGMADGKWLWHWQKTDGSTKALKVELDKDSADLIIELLESWQEQGVYDVVGALENVAPA